MARRIQNLSFRLWTQWSRVDSYFDDLAVFSVGSLHPGGLPATREMLGTHEWAGKNALDIGSGNGTTLLFLKFLGASPLGIERSPMMREAARQNGVASKHLIAGDIERLNLASLERRPFDAVIFEGVLGFVDNPREILTRISERLTASGKIFISDWMPHARMRLPEYGFIPHGRTDPTQLEVALKSHGFCCTRQNVSCRARAFDLELEEGERRAAMFFPRVRASLLRSVVARKMAKLSKALPTDLVTERFILTAVR
jgi:SAM-dependent methyltransferase